MSTPGDNSYGEIWAPYYDDIFPDVDHSAIDLLEGFSRPSMRALELAIGTGRVALPLAARGVSVTGIDNSERMLDVLRAKPGGEGITVVTGDLAEVDVAGEWPLIYLPFNTLFILTTQQRQVECFQNVAAHLESGGRFVLDTFVPDMKRWDEQNTRMGVSSISSDTVHAYEMTIHHPIEQKNVSHMVRRLESGESVVLPVTIRYVWPSEMDLMARLAGLVLEDRWGWYDRRPFNDRSGQHVSVYRKP